MTTQTDIVTFARNATNNKPKHVDDCYDEVFEQHQKPAVGKEYEKSIFFQNKKFSEYIDRFLRQDGSITLKSSEIEMIRFIVNRTIDFKKTTERIKLSHFEKGVYKRDGTLVQMGLSYKSRTISYIIKSLKAKGMIIVDRNPKKGNSYSLNFQHPAFNNFRISNDYSIKPTKESQKKPLKIVVNEVEDKKNLAENDCAESAQGDAQNLQNSIYISNQTKRNQANVSQQDCERNRQKSSSLENRENNEEIGEKEKRTIQKEKENFCEDMDDVLIQDNESEKTPSDINVLLENNQKSQEAQIERAKKRSISIVNIQALWMEALSKASYSNRHIVATLSKMERGMIKQGLQRDLKRDFADRNRMDEIPEFFAFCVNHWGTILRSKFGWMIKNAPPHEPDFVFFVKFRKKFFEAYWQEYSLLKYTGGTFRSNLVSTLIKKGFSEKEAVEEARVQSEIEKYKSAWQNKVNAASIAKREAEQIKHVTWTKAMKEADDYRSYLHRKIFKQNEQAFLDQIRAKMIEHPSMSSAETQRELEAMMREMLGDDYVE